LRNSLLIKPILVDGEVMPTQLNQQSPGSQGLEHVLWKPCFPALLLQLWPDIVDASQKRKASRLLGSVATLSEEADLQNTSAGTVEFQSAEFQPGPSRARAGQRKTGRLRSNISLPSNTSSTSSPLTEASVRRSSKLNRTSGFCEVQLEREPAKKRKISIIAIDAKIGESGPVPLSVL